LSSTYQADAVPPKGG